MNSIYRTLAVILLAFGFTAFSIHALAALTAHLDRDRIHEGETVRLTIEAEGQVSEMPDTHALNDDFEVAGTMSGSRVNIVNGSIDSRTTWTISLIPRRSGSLTIPPLEINGEFTPELTVQVSDVSANAAPNANTPIFMETEVDTAEPYVQGMVRYTQRVFFAVNLAQGSLSEPEHDNIIIRKLGEDREYTAQRHGRSYNVIEREFVVFPQVSGNLVIPASVLNAQIPDNTNRRDPFFDRFFSNTRPFRLRSETVTLNVRPRPDQSKSSYWLPAESVELFEAWQPEADEVNFGDPVTRNITIKALGLTGEQLPELALADPEGFKLYPDRAQSNTQNLQRTVQGEKILRFAYMPTKAGKHTLPELTLRWWNTETDSEHITTLPARTIEVLPATDTQQHTAAPLSDTTVNSGSIEPQRAVQKTESDSLLSIPSTHNVVSIAGHAGWFWAALGFALLWLITLGLFWRARRVSLQSREKEKPNNNASGNIRQARKQFLAACHDNDPKQARNYLIQWAALHWPASPPGGLGALALKLNDPDIQQILIDLDRVLYQGSDQAWDGRELAKRLPELPKHRHQSENMSNRKVLPSLYS